VDRYARVRGIPGALITICGVGVLSAINRNAGAYSEHVRINHIVGNDFHIWPEKWDHDPLYDGAKLGSRRLPEDVGTGIISLCLPFPRFGFYRGR